MSQPTPQPCGGAIRKAETAFDPITPVKQDSKAKVFKGLATVSNPDNTVTPTAPQIQISTPPTKSLSRPQMAKHRTPRAEKRHLVRWSDEMDKKLLLTIQSECNAAGISLPWTEIGATMGEKISGGAVIQHLAKLRARMVAQGLSVPPPLRRGIGYKISTGSSMPKKMTPSKPASSRASISKTGNAKKKAQSMSEGEDPDEYCSDSDAEYGKPRAKRAKTASAKAQSRMKNIKLEDSDEEFDTPTKHGKKRPVIEESYVECDSDNDVKSENDEEVDMEFVATGAPFLALEDDVPTKRQVGRKTVVKAEPEKRLIVTLSLKGRKSNRAKGQNDGEDTESAEDKEDSHGSGLPLQAYGRQSSYNASSNTRQYLALGSLDQNAHRRTQSDIVPGGHQSRYGPSDGPHAVYNMPAYNSLPPSQPNIGYEHNQLPSSSLMNAHGMLDLGYGFYHDAEFEDRNTNPWDEDNGYSMNFDHSFHYNNEYGHDVSVPGQLTLDIPRQENMASGSYVSTGSSTVNQTPSSGFSSAAWPNATGAHGADFQIRFDNVTPDSDD